MQKKIFSVCNNTENIFFTWPKITKAMVYQESMLKYGDSSFLITELEHPICFILEIETSFLLNITMAIIMNKIA